MTPGQRTPQASHEPYDSFFAEIRGFVGQMNDLHLQAVREQRPVVMRLIRSGSQDHRKIERTLDLVLHHACISAGLELFKALCRHYSPINPAATARYVQAYRELWDSVEAAEEGDAR